MPAGYSQISHISLHIFPRDIEILGWCPVGPVLPHGLEGASLALVGIE